MKANRGCGLLPWLVAAISMLMLRPGLLFADDGTVMSLGLNAGESYVINNVAPGETPAVNVITNPHALVVNSAPGKVVLVGAEAGEWTLAVKTTDGSTIKYDVTVKAITNIYDINHPGTSPAAISGSGATSGTAAPVAAKMDAGTGPVVVASSSSSSSSSSAGSAAPSGSFSTTTNTVSASAPAPEAASAAPGSPIAPPPVSHANFDFYPSVPAASYSPPASTQTASGALSNERF